MTVAQGAHIREKVPLLARVIRLCACFCVVVIGGAVVGFVFGAGVALHTHLFVPVSVQSKWTVADNLGLYLLAGAGGGAGLGAISSPLTVACLFRTRWQDSVWRMYACTSLAAMASVVHPAIGFITAAITLAVLCIRTLIMFPRVWPAILPPGHCGRCGYDITGLSAVVCPECGETLPGPRDCRVCLRRLPNFESNRRPWKRKQRFCEGCKHDIPIELTCQRCGNPLSPDSVNCPGCHRPTGLLQRT